jgi:hypothetical protein
MKGQTAVEYLMTYGWAILIILIVAGVLAYYGIFSPSGFLGPSAKGWTQLYALQPWDLNADGTLQLQIENRVGQDIVLTHIFADNGPTAVTECTPSTAFPLTPITSGTRYPTTGLMSLACLNATGTKGSSYSITVEIDYTVGSSTLKQTATLSGSRS